MSRSAFPRRVAYLCAALLLLTGAGGGPARAASSGASATEEDDLDAFMQKVLERRLTNWEDLYRYTLRDRERLEVRGPGGEIVAAYHGEFLWYVREGYMVRSPYEVDGARVGDEERERYEQEFLRRLRERDEQRRNKRERAEESGEPLEREYFLDFPFEPGHYLLAGPETLEGMPVLRIEYYPEKLFEDDDEQRHERKPARGEDAAQGQATPSSAEVVEAKDEQRAGAPANETDEQAREQAEWVRRFAKASRITLWVLPEQHQIVRVRYEDLGLAFLPLRWLAHVEGVTAEMTLNRPFEDLDVWLPREIVARARAVTAEGPYEFEYRLEYFDYKETEVAAKVRFRLPGLPEQQR